MVLEDRSVVPPLIRRDAIRKAREDDAARLAALAELGGHREWQARIRNGIVLVAEEDSEIAGYIRAETINEEARLDLYVFDWDRGIERQLLKRLISQLRRDGLRSAVMPVDQHNVELGSPSG